MQVNSSIDQYNATEEEVCRFHAPVYHPYADFFALDEHDVIERRTSQPLKPAVNQCSEFLIPGIHFMFYSYKAAHHEHFAYKSAAPYISMVFSLKNHCTYTNNKNMVFAEVGNNEHQIIFISNQETQVKWQGEQDAEVFIINLTLDYFKRFLSANHPLQTAFKSSLYENTPAVLIDQQLTISTRMLALLYDIAQCNYKAEYKRMFIKSKVIELLMLQFEQSEKASGTEDISSLKDTTVEKMHMARDIIMANLSQSCSILDLAQQVGTNDCYLKKHFKQVFGTTVYGYLQKERMEKSRELLLEGRKKISEVARLTGYKHASHFTTAFKRYFGYLPNKIKLAFFSFVCETEVLLALEANVIAAA